MNSLFRSLKFRLTAWYGCAFTISLAVVFGALDLYLRHSTIKQIDQFLAAESGRMADMADRRKIKILQADIDRFANFYGETKVLLRIMDSNGFVLASSDTASWTNSGRPDFLPPGVTPGDPVYVTQGRTRAVYAASVGGKVVHVARTLSDYERTLRTSRNILLAGLLLTLLSGTVFAWIIVRRAMLRVEEVTSTAVDIAMGDLSRRVIAGRSNDEIAGLATAFNVMIGKLDALMTELRATSDNIAHELRTPITRIRGTVEPYLVGRDNSAEQREVMALVVEECDRMSNMINVMLQIARLEAGSQMPPFKPVGMLQTIRHAAEAFDLLIADKQLTLELDLPQLELEVCGDRSSLQRMLSNLLDNAIRHTRTGGRITISCRECGESMELVVADNGEGISETDLPHIFERFYCATGSSNRTGTGLGLCLVRSIVHAHRGTISVQSKLGSGTRFVILLPRSAA